MDLFRDLPPSIGFLSGPSLVDDELPEDFEELAPGVGTWWERALALTIALKVSSLGGAENAICPGQGVASGSLVLKIDERQENHSPPPTVNKASFNELTLGKPAQTGWDLKLRSVQRGIVTKLKSIKYKLKFNHQRRQSPQLLELGLS